MSEPQTAATETIEVVPGIRHWSISDERINGFVSSAHSLAADGGVVLIDPLPLQHAALDALGPVTAICLTTSSHQRSCWRLRRELGVPVHAPAFARELDEEPDGRYGDGDRLPGDLLAVFTPGAGTTQHTFLLEQGPGVAFVPDLLARPPGMDVMLTPAEYMHNPREARQTLAQLLERRFDVMCLGHGAPVTSGAHEAIRAALAG
jgi:hypothetical protein